MQNNINFTFRKNRVLQFGEKLFVSGNLPQLGEWKIDQAIQMKWTEGNNWEATIPIPSTLIQYKFVIQDTKGKRSFEPTPNRKLNLQKQSNKLLEPKLTLMSYNIRMDTNADKEFAWKYRKDHAVEKLLEHLPSIIGVQQAKKHQKIQLCDRLYDHYDYFGIARDLKQCQECGIFFLRHRFRVFEHGFIWFNETLTPGEKGFGARLPRKLTYLVLEDTFLNLKFIVINTHLDHETPKSQVESVKIIVQTLQTLSNKYKIETFFVMGDFNVQQNNICLKPLYQSQFKFLSTRRNAKVSDTFPTFHQYKGEEMMEKIKNGKKEFWWTIDHIFYSGKRLVPEQFRVLVTGKPYMSDHYPVYGVFSLSK